MFTGTGDMRRVFMKKENSVHCRRTGRPGGGSCNRCVLVHPMPTALVPIVEAQLSNSLGRKVLVGNLSLSRFSGGISARDISIADDLPLPLTPRG
jgi:hypothetical protein